MLYTDDQDIITEKEQFHVLTADVRDRARTIEIIEGTFIVVAINKESVDMISELSSNASDITTESKHYSIRGDKKPMASIELVSKSRTNQPSMLCVVKDATTVNEYLERNKKVKYAIFNEEQLVSILNEEYSYLNSLYKQNETTDHNSAGYYSNLATLDFRAKAFFYFLCIGNAYSNKNLKNEIEKDRKRAEEFSVFLDKKILEIVSRKNLFFVGVKENVSTSNIKPDLFIKFGDHRDKERRTLNKEEYLLRRQVLNGIAGNLGRKRLETKKEAKERKAAASASGMADHDLSKYLSKNEINILQTVKEKPSDDDVIEIPGSGIEKRTVSYILKYNELPEIKGSPFVINREVASKTKSGKEVYKYTGFKKSWLKFFNVLINTKIKRGDVSDGRINKEFVDTSVFNSVIDAAYESISAGAAAGGVTPAEQYSIDWEITYEKIKKFETTQFENEDDINTEYMNLYEFINRKCVFNEEQNKNAIQLLERITAVKIAQLDAAATLRATAASAATSEEESGVGYQADGNYFHMDVRTNVDFGVFTEIDVDQNKREKFSWTKKLAEVCNELWGYEPLGVVTSTINKYSALRDFNGSVLKRSGEIADSIIQVALPNFHMGEDIGAYIKTTTNQKPGEVDPQIMRLEQALRNPGQAVRNASILKKTNRDNSNYTNHIKDIDSMTTSAEEKEAAENKKKYNTSKYLRQNEGIDYSKIFGITGINEDFAPAGGFCEGTGGTNQVGEVITPGTEFTYPGMVSGLGAIHAPTPEQKPFVNGEKTSKSSSGSGDCFQVKSSGGSKTGNKKKKYKSKIPLIRVAE